MPSVVVTVEFVRVVFAKIAGRESRGPVRFEAGDRLTGVTQARVIEQPSGPVEYFDIATNYCCLLAIPYAAVVIVED